MFDKIFQASHFCYDWQGVRFIGCGAGPSLRMGPPHIPREEILWLDSIVRATPAEQPIIFIYAVFCSGHNFTPLLHLELDTILALCQSPEPFR